MKKLIIEELRKKIKLHKKENKKCLDLSFCDLSCLDLSCLDLSNTNLSNTNLSYSNLEGTNLSNSNLSCADLSYANLSYANLIYADLKNADLKNIKLYKTIIDRCTFSEKVVSIGNISPENYLLCRKAPCFSYGDIRHAHRICVSN